MGGLLQQVDLKGGMIDLERWKVPSRQSDSSDQDAGTGM